MDIGFPSWGSCMGVSVLPGPAISGLQGYVRFSQMSTLPSCLLSDKTKIYLLAYPPHDGGPPSRGGGVHGTLGFGLRWLLV